MKSKFLLACLCLVLMVPVVAAAETMYVDTPNGGSVNLRFGPSEDEEVLTSVGYGEAVEVLEVLYGSSWVNVSYNGYYGYVMMRYLSYYPPGPLPTFVPAPTAPHPNPTKAPPNPTRRPNPAPSDGDARLLSALFAGFGGGGYQAIVVPSTPSNYVNLRWAPSKSAPVRSQYWANAAFTVLSTNGAWSEVMDMETNTHGFMMSSFLTPVTIVGNPDGGS